MNKTLLILVSHVSFFMSHRFEIALEAKKLGYKVKVAFGEIDEDIKYLSEKGIESFHVPIQRGGINPFSEARSLLSLWSLFRKLKPDIVHLVTIKPYLYGGIIARLIGMRCLVSAVSGLGSLFVNNNLKAIFLRMLLYPIFKAAFNHDNQKIILQNKNDLKVLEDWGVLNSLKVKLLKGSGVNLENFDKYDEPVGVPVICFAARLIKEKGVNEFVAAAKILNERNIKAKYLLAGEVDQNNPSGLTEYDLNKIKEDGYVEVLGYYKNIAELYSLSNIICLPSYREGLPKGLIEAAAACRAVVTTDVPGCRDAIIPNKTGLLVPVKNSKKLADALQWLIENPKERVLMGKAGRKFAEKEFAIEKIVKTHINIYQELIENK